MLSAQPSVVLANFVWRNRRRRAEDSSSELVTHNTRAGLSNTYSESSNSIVVDKVLASDKRSQLFSILKPSRLIYPTLFERYLHSKTRDSMKLFEVLNTRHKFYTNRWEAMPKNPSNENEVAYGFFSIADKVSTSTIPGYPETDLFKAQLFDTHTTRIPDNHGNSHLQPDLFVQAFGRHFPVISHSVLSPPWAVCLTIGDFKLGAPKNREYFSQLATYAEQLVSAQDNRRFVETFCMDEKYLVFHIFDRGGSVTSDPVDYHRDPWKLIALIEYLLLGKDRWAVDAGIDESVYYENGQTYIQTPSKHAPTKQDTWLLLKTLFRATDLRGPGTVFWLVRETNNNRTDQKIRLIKDEWVVGGCQHEQDLHQLVGSLPGVAPLEISYNMTFGNRLDT
ncbi:MAG TPA: hypothetical protein VGO47_01070, partial [Chlamydiales bacterium]|nr:hypothetical protein [Chlamydiales bacterium]